VNFDCVFGAVLLGLIATGSLCFTIEQRLASAGSLSGGFVCWYCSRCTI
jgi:hypothetical protein